MDNITKESVEEIDSQADNLKKVEAALFIAGKFLSLQELVMLTDINPILLRELLDKITDRYNHDESAIEIIRKEDSWKMDVRQDYVYMINKLATGSAEFSKAEQETLAVIAYKQPVKQSVIIKIRGNKAYEHIRNFISMGLVTGKRVGHTLELGLGDDFYNYFHVIAKSKNGEQVELERVAKEESEGE